MALRINDVWSLGRLVLSMQNINNDADHLHPLHDVIIHCMSSGQFFVIWSNLMSIVMWLSFSKDRFWSLLVCLLARLKINLLENVRFITGN